MFAEHGLSLYGDSENLLGKWFKRTGKRDQVFLATKFGYVKGDQPLKFGTDSSAEYCKKSCTRSLEILGITCIDLCEYYSSYAVKSPIVEMLLSGSLFRLFDQN